MAAERTLRVIKNSHMEIKRERYMDSNIDLDSIVVYNRAVREYGKDSGNGIVIDNIDNI